MKQRELPYHLKDMHTLKWSLHPFDIERPTEVKELVVQFNIEHARLQQAMALVYDKVYTKQEVDFIGMKTKIRVVHQKLITLGYSLTDMI